jgi:hypothetical protein
MPHVRRRGFRKGFDPTALEAPGAVRTYAITDGTSIKIGKSEGHPVLRLGILQVGNPRELRLLAWTLGLSEADAHRKLRSARIRGEWYKISPLVLRLVGRFDWLDGRLLARLWGLVGNGMAGVSPDLLLLFPRLPQTIEKLLDVTG